MERDKAEFATKVGIGREGERCTDRERESKIKRGAQRELCLKECLEEHTRTSNKARTS